MRMLKYRASSTSLTTQQASVAYRSVAIPKAGYSNHTIKRETVDHGVSVDNRSIGGQYTNRTSIQ